MSPYRFPEANPQGPIPGPNTIHCTDRPAARAGRELSAYGDQSYPQAQVNPQARYGRAQPATDRRGEPQSGDSSLFGDFEPGM